MVRKERLELSRRKTLEPKSSASTNFATSALPAQNLPEGASVKARDGVTEAHYFQRIGALWGRAATRPTTARGWRTATKS